MTGIATRRDILKGLGLGAAACCAPSLFGAEKHPRPNIIFMLADDLGWMDTGIYGSTFYDTPNIDALARRGMRFTSAYAASPLCSPTRASILTGEYPGRLRFTVPSGHLPQVILDPIVPARGPSSQRVIMPQSRTRLPNETITYAEALKEVGYATGFFGKWHLGRPPYIPENQGFDTVVGGREHPGPPPKGHYFSPWMCPTLPKVPDGSHICDVLTTEAIHFMERHKDGPFLMNLWFYDVHAPFQSKKDWIEYYRRKADPKNPQHCPTMAAMIRVLDENVGRLTRRLEELGLADNTLIIFFSDNGGNMYDSVDGTTPTNNAPLRGGKATMYEGGTREPCFVVWPDHVAPNTVSDQIFSSVDWYPTLLDILGLKPKPGQILDGVSIWPALQGREFDRGPIFCHFPHSPKVPDWVGPATSVRLGDWKLVRIWFDNPDGSHRYELYNLREDLCERENLASIRPDLVQKLDALIEQHVRRTKALCPKLNPAYAPPIDGWSTSADAKLALADGCLVLTSTGGDPYMFTHEVPGLQGKIVCRIRLKSDSRGEAALHWGTMRHGRKGFTRGRRIPWHPKHDEQWQTIDIPFQSQAPLFALRLDPCTAPGTVYIDWIRLVDDRGRVVKTWDFSR